MDQNQFWDVVERACRRDVESYDDWTERLEEELIAFPAEEIVEWNHLFDGYARRAYTNDLWGAAYLINGGASDDGFYYFRCWLIGMGRKVYDAAIGNPDSLAEVVEPGVDAEVESYGAAHQAWMRVTGLSDQDDYPARNEEAELVGDAWDFDDEAEARRRLPRLAALFLE